MASNDRLQALLAKARANLEARNNEQAADVVAGISQDITNGVTVDLSGTGLDKDLKTDLAQEAAIEFFETVAENVAEATEQQTKRIIGVTRDIILNEKQLAFHDTVVNGGSCVLIGPAGTGKTTSVRKTTRSLIDSGRVKNLTEGTKWLRVGKPGIVVVAYTRKATNNIRHAVVEELKEHTITCHKLVEFAPVKYEIEDPNSPTGFRTTMRFEPKRNATNPLPAGLTTIFHEEGSMESVELNQQVRDAMPHEHQEIYLGDLNQLPPIFGLAILGFKMLEHPVIELTEVYRQALKSPIIQLAHKILEGNPHEFSSRTERYTIETDSGPKTRIRCPELDKFDQSTDDGTVKFQIWQKRLSADLGLLTTVKQFTTWADQGYYNPEEDIILCPFNKAFGTIELNKGIAFYLGTQRKAVVHEIIAGYNKHYLAIGDRVLYDKEDAFIVDITRNSEYLGKHPMPSSVHLDRWGNQREALTAEEVTQVQQEDSSFDLEATEKLLSSAIDSIDERVNAASHVVVVRFAYEQDSDQDVVLDTAAEINNMLGGYAITVHKSQGSEWDKVFFLMQHTHAVMCQRELLYTAVTRAKNFLHIIAEPDTFEKGIKSQKIKGNTIKEKAEFFKGKADDDKAQQLKMKMEMDAREKHEQVKVIGGVPAIDITKLVSEEHKAKYQRFYDSIWQTATGIFTDKIGEQPRLDFNIRSSRILGRAKLRDGILQLNPIWASLEDTEVVQQNDCTIIHEVCHFVAYRIYKDAGHGEWWKYCMKKMAQTPDRLYTGTALPPWMQAKEGLLKQVCEQYKLRQGVDVTIEEDSDVED